VILSRAFRRFDSKKMEDLIDAIASTLHLDKEKKEGLKSSSSSSSSSSASASDDEENGVAATLSNLLAEDEFECVVGKECDHGDPHCKPEGNEIDGPDTMMTRMAAREKSRWPH